ncbi:Beta-glucosidase 5 [Dichanthelium oligosanthes]|uniref:Beta-glucosidase 5 n=1 Tax=Dichanthelium oligosanthes TaxID=888268 RepID=A0A1E5VBX3_9POAL|nr:Beta-glucosidase 5 [Dichanthelium oligosanthes]
MKKNVGSRLPSFTKVQSEAIRDTLDFIGINHYDSFYVNDRPLEKGIRDFSLDIAAYFRGSRTDPPIGQVKFLINNYSEILLSSAVSDITLCNQHAPTSVPADPKGLQLLVEYLNEAYGNLPIYIQETGKSISLLKSSKILVQIFTKYL